MQQKRPDTVQRMNVLLWVYSDVTGESLNSHSIAVQLVAEQ